MKNWEEHRGEEDEEEGASPKGLFCPLQESKGQGAQVGFQELGPLTGESPQGHPQVSLTSNPPVVERILMGVPPGTQHGAPSVSPSWFILFPPDSSPSPLPCPGQGGAQVKLGARRGPGTFCSFLHHWLPGQECVMSPIVVTGLQECGH